MLITKIEEFNKKQVKIEIDHEFAFVLYKGELRTYGMVENKEISDGTYQGIVEKLLPKRVKLRAMNLLKSKSYTECQLRDKLSAGLYDQKFIDEALEYVKSYGYIDDEAYAQDFVDYHMENKSKKRITLDLLKRGIDKKVIEQIFEEKKENGETLDELSMAAKFLRKKNFDFSTATTKEIQKMSTFLYRKGFDSDTIRRVLLLDITTI